MKIVTNECFGGFGLSSEGADKLCALGYTDHPYEVPRDDPRLVQVVEDLGDAASGGYARLKVVTIPDGIEWHIHEYDGSETVHEEHRSWTSEGPSTYC